MTQFEFFMAFYGLLLGLGVAELLGGFANLLRHRRRPTLGLLTPLLGVTAFLQLMAAFIDAWQNLQGVAINMPGLAVPTLIGVALFAVNIIVVPRDPSEWTDLDQYFFVNRRWTLGLLVFANILVLVHEAPRVTPAVWHAYLLINFVAFALLIAAWLAKPRPVIAASMVLLDLLMLSLYSPYSVLTPLTRVLA